MKLLYRIPTLEIIEITNLYESKNINREFFYFLGNESRGQIDGIDCHNFKIYDKNIFNKINKLRKEIELKELEIYKLNNLLNEPSIDELKTKLNIIKCY